MLKSALIAAGLLAALPALAGQPAAPAAKAARQVEACPQVGTWLRLKPGHCSTGSSVRVYTSQDLERTGESNVSDALRKLDPRFR